MRTTLHRLRDIARRLLDLKRRRSLEEAEAEILRLREVGQEYFDELQATRRRLSEAQTRRDELVAEAREERARGIGSHTYVCIVCGHEVQDPVPEGEDPEHHGSPRPDGKCPTCLSHWMVRKRPGLRCLPVCVVDCDWDFNEPADAYDAWMNKVLDARRRSCIRDDGAEDIPF